MWGQLSKNAPVVGRLLDLGEKRIADMDSAGIAMQVLSLTAPGVQMFERDEAVGLARSSNDQLAEAVRKYPERFAGLAAIAPQGSSGGGGEGTGTGRAAAGAEGRDRQFAHSRRVSG